MRSEQQGACFHRGIRKRLDSDAARVFKYVSRNMECHVLGHQIRSGGLDFGISC